MCDTCGSERILKVFGKCSDLCVLQFNESEKEGYVASDCGIGGGDDIDFQDDALPAMVSSDIKLLHVHSGSTIVAPYWQYWTSVTGGAFAQINSDGSVPGGLDLTDLIVALLELIP